MSTHTLEVLAGALACLDTTVSGGLDTRVRAFAVFELLHAALMSHPRLELRGDDDEVAIRNRSKIRRDDFDLVMLMELACVRGLLTRRELGKARSYRNDVSHQKPADERRNHFILGLACRLSTLSAPIAIRLPLSHRHYCFSLSLSALFTPVVGRHPLLFL